MQLPIVRRIRDNLHGSIDISDVEDRVLAHPTTQRLRRIRQTAFLAYVFPGATHSRFEHSLGVMHLAGVAWEKLKHNQERLRNSTSRIPDFAKREVTVPNTDLHGRLAPTLDVAKELFGSSYTLQALRLAALLHDLGHPPFSHSGERFLPSYTEVIRQNPGLPRYLADYLELRVNELKEKNRDPDTVKVRHEIYTLLFLDEVLREVYEENPSLENQVHPQDVASILDVRISPRAGTDLARWGTYVLCHELVSAEFDVDRMDYLLRDSRECGVVYGIFDDHRILDSLVVYMEPEKDQLHLAIHFSGLAAFEDYLRARLSMYLQLYFHKTSVAAEAMMQHIAKQIPGWTIPANRSQYRNLDEFNIRNTLTEACLQSSLNIQTKDEILRTIDDLLRNRNLWKRVFEISDRHNDDAASLNSIEEAKKILTKTGSIFEQVDSKGSLTNFKPREGDAPSKNYLRLVKKDNIQFPRVVPIEDYTSIINSSRSINIMRLYVQDGTQGQGKNAVQAARAAIQEHLLNKI